MTSSPPRPDDPAEGAAPARTFRVPPAAAGTRLDRFLADRLRGASRRSIMDAAKAGRVLVDGRRSRPGTLLAGGEEVVVPPLGSDRSSAAPSAPSGPHGVDVIHRDDDLLVVSKPAGVPCHGGAGLGVKRTLLELLKEDVLAGFGLANRIDQDTTGLVVLVRGAELRAATSAAFAADGVVEKVYDALVEGVPDPAVGAIDLPLAPPGHGGTARVDREGKPSRTEYATLESFGTAARVRAVPVTGRTHQIRVHLAAIGTPLLVDPLYGRRSGWRLVDPKGGPAARLSRTPLHAAEVTLPHPRTGERMTFHAPLLPDHRRALEVLRVVAARAARRAVGPEAEANRSADEDADPPSG